MNRRIIIIISSFIILFAIVLFLIINFGQGLEKKDKITIYTTIYPEYDFTKAIVGNKIEVVRLIQPGTEIHTYEPSSKDMARISNSSAFIYTGKNMEPWAEKIIESIKDNNVRIIDTSKNINMIDTDEFMEQYSLLDERKEEHTHHEDEEKDGHIWLNPQNATIMIDTILENIIDIDPKNKNYYEENANRYKDELKQLDEDIEKALIEKNVKVLAFGGEFAYSYFCQRYNLKVISCYTACGEHSEPSITRIKDVIEFINKNEIKSIFYEELSEGQVSQMISEETQAKAQVFNTLHNVTQEDISNGENYISIMKRNLNKILNSF